MSNQQANLDTESAKIALEQAKVDIEKLKLELEKSKLEVEKNKAKWAAVAITVPVLVTVLTLGFNSWSQNQQAKQQMEIQSLQSKQQAELLSLQSNNQLKMQQEQSQNQLELKIADIVLNAPDPVTAYNKVRAMVNILNNRLPSDLGIKYKNMVEDLAVPPNTDKNKPSLKTKNAKWTIKVTTSNVKRKHK